MMLHIEAHLFEWQGWIPRTYKTEYTDKYREYVFQWLFFVVSLETGLEV